MTKYESLIRAKDIAERKGANGEISIADAQQIVADVEDFIANATIAELSEKV